MSEANKTYTYRAGEKIELDISPDQMVVRALPRELNDPAILNEEQVSSGSTRITTSAPDLDAAMARSRESAPTHHAYSETATGSEFLITDRVFVTFKAALSDTEVDAFAGRYGLIKKFRVGRISKA